MNNFWNIPAPYPCGPFDLDAELNFSFDFSRWAVASGPGVTVQEVTVINGDGLTFSGSSLDAGVFTVRISKTDPATGKGLRIPFTLRATLSDGQRDERTYMLEMRQR